MSQAKYVILKCDCCGFAVDERELGMQVNLPASNVDWCEANLGFGDSPRGWVDHKWHWCPTCWGKIKELLLAIAEGKKS